MNSGVTLKRLFTSDTSPYFELSRWLLVKILPSLSIVYRLLLSSHDWSTDALDDKK